MSDNDTLVEPPLDAEDWEIAFAPYEGNPGAALRLGFNLMVLKSYLAVEPLKIQAAIEGIDRGIEALFPHTQFREVSYDLFLKVVEGRLTLEEEQILKAMGIKF